MADGGEQGRAHAVGLRERADLAGGVGEVAVLERGVELRGDDPEEPPAGRLEVVAVEGEHAAGSHGHVGRGPAGDDAIPRDRLVAVHELHALQAERLAGAAHERVHGALAAEHGSGDGRQQLGLGDRAAGEAGAAGGLVDDPADEQCDDHVEHEREQVQRLVDGDRVERVDEEVVERESGEHGGEQGGPDPADERDEHHEQLVREHVARDRVVGARGREQPGEQRAAAEREQPAEDPAPHAERAAPDARQPEAPARGRVRDDVHVDVAGLADHRGADAGPGRGGGEAAAAADAEHELRGVGGARELDERARDVVADDLVVAAAERVDERALAGERLGAAGAEAVLTGDVHGHQLAAGGAGRDPGAAP